MDHIILTNESLNFNDICNLVSDDSCGAISFFLGTTRDNFESKKVLSLEYEAYEPMAIKEIKKICVELRSRWTDIVNIAIFHRLGLVKVREASVIIAISSPHRQSALDGTSQAIEELKRRVPIWKKEKYEDQASTWKENKECTWRRKTAENNFKILNITCQKTCNTPELKNLVQISAPESEIERRIRNFVKMKRDQIDSNNTLDFIAIENDEETRNYNTNKTTCARTDSIILRQEHCKGHLKVKRARNAVGPQIKINYLQALKKHMSKTKSTLRTSQVNCSVSPKPLQSVKINGSGRISDIEDYLRIQNCETKTIYEQLKEIENRILSLEALSPEYIHFLEKPVETSVNSVGITYIEKNAPSLVTKNTYSLNQLDDLIKSYENKYDTL